MQIIIHLPEKTVEIKGGIPYENWLFGVTSRNVTNGLFHGLRCCNNMGMVTKQH